MLFRNDSAQLGHGGGPIARSRSRGFLTVVGIVLLPISLSMLGFNEVRTVRMAHSLEEIAGVVQGARTDRVDPGLEGKLVHVAGKLQVAGTLSDPDFPINAVGAVQLRRAVQTYQWQEVHEGRASSSAYSYRPVWSEQRIDSSSFHDRGGAENPPQRYSSQHLIASEATLGVFHLPQSLLRDMRTFQAVSLTDAVLRPGTRRDGNTLYVGDDPGVPRIGDQRLTWEVVETTDASVIAQQRGSGLSSYRTAAGDAFQAIRPGIVEAKNMVDLEEQANESVTWMGRIIGAALLYGAFCLVLTKLSLALSLDRLREGGTAIGAALLTVVAVPLAIGVARLVVHPVSGVAALAVALGIGYLLRWRLQAVRTP